MFDARSKKTLMAEANPDACYPERMERADDAGRRLLAQLSWTLHHRWYFGEMTLRRIVGPVKKIGAEFAGLSDSGLREEAVSLRRLLGQHGFRTDLVARSFALVSETARRTIGKQHYPVQLMGGLALLRGNIAEMATGEGKTLTATLPACTAALAGLPVHVITVNDYLVQRDADLMRPVYEALGLTVGYVIQGMDPARRIEAYRCDVTYCNNKELVFDYLKDRILLGGVSSPAQLQLERLYKQSPRGDRLLHRGLYYAIVDEADSVMVDEARTPLIIAGQKSSRFAAELYHEALDLAQQLAAPDDFTIDAERGVTLTPGGTARLDTLIEDKGLFWHIRPNREELVGIALQAIHRFMRDRHYLVSDGTVQIIDEYTGRVMPDRNWEGGLHQMIEVKEGCEISGLQETISRITYQRFFRRYLHLSGMTGTAAEVAREMWMVYGLKPVRIPTNRPSRRKQQPEKIFATSDEKWSAIVDHVVSVHEQRRPVLIGTRSVEASEHLSRLFTKASLPHTVLNARQDKHEAEVVQMAGEQGRVTIATNMAGRGTDIHLGPGVAEIGGLHVVLTEHHEARRIDRQLYGRCARQGDPGTCIAVTSLDDEVVVENFSRGMPAGLAGLLPPVSATPRWARKLIIHLSQVSAEARHAAIRHETLKTDSKLDQLLSFTGRVE